MHPVTISCGATSVNEGERGFSFKTREQTAFVNVCRQPHARQAAEHRLEPAADEHQRRQLRVEPEVGIDEDHLAMT